MQEVIGNYQFKLVNDTVYISDVKTKELLKAKSFAANDAVNRFNAICKHWRSKLAVA